MRVHEPAPLGNGLFLCEVFLFFYLFFFFMDMKGADILTVPHVWWQAVKVRIHSSASRQLFTTFVCTSLKIIEFEFGF